MIQHLLIVRAIVIAGNTTVIQWNMANATPYGEALRYEESSAGVAR